MKRFFTNPISITSQVVFCGLPLRLDTYAGCGFRCSFCFARFRGGNAFDDSIRPASARSIANTFRMSILEQRFEYGIVAQFLRQRVPLHFGGMSDPFQPAEYRWRVTRDTLITLAEHHYPTVISTRGTIVSEPDYLALLRAVGPVVVQFSFSSTRNITARRPEPHSTPPSELLRTIEKVSKEGIPTTCRWQPYIPGVSESPEEFVPRIASAGIRHISVEHLKLPVERRSPMMRMLNEGAGRDLWNEYKQLGAYRDARELLLPAKEKLELVQAVRAIAHRLGLTFGAADNEFQYLSDYNCCCSGVDQFPGFENWFRHQIGYAVKKSRGDGRILYNAIQKEWVPTGSINRYLNSRSRLNSCESGVADLVRQRWNDPQHPTAPTSFFGVEATTVRDGSGMVVYRWRENVPSP